MGQPGLARSRARRSASGAGAFLLLFGAFQAMGVLVSSAPVAASTTTSPFTSWTSSVVDHQFPYGSSGNLNITGMSCPSTSLCVAVDQLGDVLASTNPTSLSTQSWVSTHIDGNHPLVGVSCGSTTMCLAVDGAGNIWASTAPQNSSSWTDVSPSAYNVAAPPAVPYTFSAVTCVGNAFCLVAATIFLGSGNTGNGNYIFQSTNPSNTGGWCTARIVGSALCVLSNGAVYGASSDPVINSMSCASTTQCVAVDQLGEGWGYNGTTWSGPTSYDGLNPFVSVSCTANPTVLCEAIDQEGAKSVAFFGTVASGIFTAKGGAFSADNTANPSIALSSISCPATGLCIGVGANGNGSFSTNPGSGGGTVWTSGAGTFIPKGNAVSCPATSLCFTIGSSVSGTSCTSSSFSCVFFATNPTGSTSSTWSTPGLVDGVNSLGAVSCASSSLCVVADSTGHVVTTTTPSSGNWSAPVDVDGISSLVALSCASASSSNLCVAVDSANNVVSSANPSGGASAWLAPVAIDPGLPLGRGLTSISCPSTTLCVATDSNGNVVTSTAPTGGSGSWVPVAIDNPSNNPPQNNNLTSISCPTTGLCVAVDNVGFAFTSTNPTGGAAAWTPVHVDGANVLTSVSCASTALCVAVDNAGNVIYSSNPTGGLTAWHALPNTNVGCALGSSGCNGPGSPTSFALVRCPSPNLCLALGTNASISGGAGATCGAALTACAVWATTTPASPGAGATCTTATTAWCYVPTLLNGYNTFATSPAAWYGLDGGNPAQPIITPPGVLTSLACATSALCLAGDSAGRILTGVSPALAITTTTLPSGFQNQPYGQGGAGATISATGGIGPYNWSFSSGQPPAGMSLSCTSSCASSVTLQGTPSTQGTTLFTVQVADSSSPPLTATQILSVSILGAWTVPATVDSPPAGRTATPVSVGAFTGVSCTGTLWTPLNECYAVDQAGRAIGYQLATASQPSTWQSPIAIASFALSGISCNASAYPLFCVAVGGNPSVGGQALIFNNGSWGTATHLSTNALTAVSCISNTFCVTVDSAGNAYQYTGSTSGWSTAALTGMSSASSISCTSTLFCVAVGNTANYSLFCVASGGSNGPVACTTASSTVPQWHQSTIAGAANLTSVSCPLPAPQFNFCEAVDSSGNAFVFTGTTVPPASPWAAAAGSPPLGAGGTLTSVTCVSSSFCIAVGQGGNTHGQASLCTFGPPCAWTGPRDVEPQNGYKFVGVSCTQIAFCTAVDSLGDAVGYLGGSSDGSLEMGWVGPVGSAPMVTGSCTSTSVCVAVDSANKLASYNGTTWSKPSIGLGLTVNTVSCSGTSLCVAVGNGGNFTFSTGGTCSPFPYPASGNPSLCTSSPSIWGAPAAVAGAGNLMSVSCASSTFCVAGDNAGKAFTYNGAAWSAAVAVSGSSLMSVSCASSTFCAAVDTAGNAYTYNGAAWSAASHITGVTLMSVSCASSTFCAAGDTLGDVFTFNGTVWSAASNIDGANTFNSVSCPASTFCAAVDNKGNLFTYSGTWAAAVSIDGSAPITWISCTSSSFCMAGDNAAGGGHSFGSTSPASGASSWFNPALLGNSTGNNNPQMRLTTSACDTLQPGLSATASALSHLCIQWENPVDSTLPITSISCPSSTLCVGGDDLGDVITSANTSSNSIQSSAAWSTQVGADTASAPITGMSCPSTSLCVGVDACGDMITSGSPTTSGTWSIARIDSNSGTGPAICSANASLTAVSCVVASGTTLCLAVDNVGYVFYSSNPQPTPANWVPVKLGSTPLNGVSCPTTSFCVVVGNGGLLGFTTTPTGSAQAWSLTTVDPLISGVDNQGSAYFYNGIPSTADSFPVFAGATNAVACAASVSPTGWCAPITDNLSAVSCISTSLCAAVDGQGSVVASTSPGSGGGSWTSSEVDTTPSGSQNPAQPVPLLSLGCVSTSSSSSSSALCMAGDALGRAVGSLSPTTGAPGWWVAQADQGALGRAALGAMACPTSTLCVAGDGAGQVVTTSPSPSSAVTITTTSPLAAGTVGSAYTSTFSATSGTGPYTWSSQSQLPPGLTLATTGTLSGTPSNAGTYSFTVQATDSSSPAQTAFATFSLTVSIATFSITTASGLPSGTVGTAYNQQLSASGGTKPYSWSIASGSSLPQGLQLSTAGVISGTPGGTGFSTFTITVVDLSVPPLTASAAFSLSISAGGTLAITPPNPPVANIGVAYSYTLAATGGTPPYTWSIATGSAGLPAGLSLGSGGTISGTPSASAASATVTFQVTDAASKSVTSSLVTVTVQGGGCTGSSCPPPTTTPTSSTTTAPPPQQQGYWMVASGQQVYGFGASKMYGTPSDPLPIVGMASTGNGLGYWTVDSAGGVQSFGAAISFGSANAMGAVGIAATADSGGYWIATQSGGVFTQGDAAYFGSPGQLNPSKPAGGSNSVVPLNKPLVGIAATPGGKGYWLVASDGGIFAFGDAVFYGSMGGKPLNKPVVGIAATADGRGYWEVASDGGIFTFGDAKFYGSMGGTPLIRPVVGMAATPGGKGYWMVASDGGIFSFGNATFLGSKGGAALPSPVVGMAVF